MKFLFPIALLAAAGVSAQDKNCGANYIVDRCLSTETPKIAACKSTDYDCMCAAYQAVATCYNNCPKDPRAPSADNQVTVFCKNASLYGSKTSSTMTATSLTSLTTDATTTTTDGSRPSNTATFSAANPANTGAAGELVRNTGGFMVAVAAAVAAVL